MFTRTFTKARNFVADVISGIGTDDDPGSRFELSRSRENFTRSEIISAFTLSGQIKRAINLIPEVASNYIYKDKKHNVIDIPENVSKKLEALKVRSLFCLASKSARLFKESYLMLITAKDNYEEELQQGEEILELLPLEIGQISFMEELGVRDYRLALSARKVEGLAITPSISTPIHSSRILCFCGENLPYSLRAGNGGYHGNAIGSLLSSYGGYQHSLNLSKSLLARAATFIIKIAGFQDFVDTANSGGLANRLSMLKRFIGSTGGFIIDADSEEVSWLQLNLSGVSEIVNLHSKQFTADSGLTHAEFWNEGTHTTTSAYEEVNLNKRAEQFLNNFWLDNFRHLYMYVAGVEYQGYLGMEGTQSVNVQEDSDGDSRGSGRNGESENGKSNGSNGVGIPTEGN
jgi:hypothetical protein